MTNHYRFNDDGILEPCKESDLEQLGGLKYLTASRVKDMSDGKYSEAGWIAYAVKTPMTYGNDTMADTFNPADGKMYDSKSAYYKAVKSKGLEIVGNDAPVKPSAPKQQKIDWEKAVAESLKIHPLKGKKR